MGGLRQPGPEPGGRAVAPVGFPLERRAGPPAELVAPSVPEGGGRLALLLESTARALILGSTQPESDVDRGACLAGGWEVVRRRSGGGAVVVSPGAQVWCDVFVPAGDPLAEDDVASATYWLGEVWVEALRRAGLGGQLAVHRGPLSAGRYARRACYSGLGPGEVTWEGRKAVGCSQRRTRAGAWLHTMVLVEDRHTDVVPLLSMEDRERKLLADQLVTTTASVPLAAETIESHLAELLLTA
ncbi:MAG: biotin/lipoate protein ligase [Acidimicrobiaceae bacterium]|nr:biotin/lipoate protein ligase [Acidimicrobiaceae bacterium]